MSLTTQMLCDESMIEQALNVINTQPRQEGSISLHTALYFCCQLNSSPVIIEALLRKWPGDIFVASRGLPKENPVDAFFGVDKNLRKDEQKNEDNILSFSYQRIELSSETTIVSERDTVKLLTNAYMLLFVLNNGRLENHINYANIYSSSNNHNSTSPVTQENEEDTFLVLHVSLEERRCPILFSHLFLNKHPEQAWRRDEIGKLPLELALAHNKINYSDDGEINSFLNSLFGLCPIGASFPDDLHSRLPLAKCAAMGMDVALSESDNQPPTMIILKSAPRALSTPDVTTHMLPFMLVATRGANLDDKNSYAHLLNNKPSEESQRKLGLARTESSQKMRRLDNLSKLYSWIMLDPNTIFASIVLT
jgi:hypothetical protein